MDKRTYLIILYDYYGKIFNEKQQKYFEDYYFNNLSLQEIADNYGVSRNAIHKQIISIEKKLYDFEEKLKLYEQKEKIEEILKDVKPEIKEAILKII